MVRWQWNILEGYGLLDYHGDDGDEGEEDCENRREIGAMIWRARLCSFRPMLLCIHMIYHEVFVIFAWRVRKGIRHRATYSSSDFHLA